MAMDPIERLGMHLGLVGVLLQQGTAMIAVRGALDDLQPVIDAVRELDWPDERMVRVRHLIPEGVAEEIAIDQVIPDDLSGMEDY